MHLLDCLASLAHRLILQERIALHIARAPVQVQMEILDFAKGTERILKVFFLSLLSDSCHTQDVPFDRFDGTLSGSFELLIVLVLSVHI